jgi:phage baseplate assembly protein V
MNAEIAAALRDMFRVGEVVSTNPDTVTARVKFFDTDDMVSGDLQVLQGFTVENKSYAMPDVGEDVLCLFLGNGAIAGFIIGKAYNLVDAPPETGQNITYLKFKDETLLKYDRGNHLATAEIKGDVEIDIDENEGDEDSEEDGGEDKEPAVGKFNMKVKDSVTLETPIIDFKATESFTLETPSQTIAAENEVIIEAPLVEVNSDDVNLGNGANSAVVCELSPCPLFGIFHPGSSKVKATFP